MPTPNDGSTKFSLFLQVNSISNSELQRALDHIANHHRDPAKDDYIYNIVLNEIGYETGELRFSTLEVLKPYLPGGPKACFDNVFVGSMFLPWNGPGNAYREGISDGAYRWANLEVQKKLWLEFKAWFGNRPWHFYVNYEGVLDYLDEYPVKVGMEAYLIQSTRDANAVKPGSAVMWSPAIWSGTILTANELNAFDSMMDAVDWYASSGGYTTISWLHLQDMLGRSWGGASKELVKKWYDQIKSKRSFASLRVNTELFTPSYQPVPIQVYRDRMDYYEANNILVGGSFELRYWFREHQEIE